MGNHGPKSSKLSSEVRALRQLGPQGGGGVVDVLPWL